MKELLLMALANGLVNNVVLSRFLGLCSFMGVSNKIESAMGMAMATTFVLTMSTCVGWLIEHLILQPLGLEYLRLLAFIMVIASLVQLTELFVAKQSPELHRTLGIFLPLITTNCAVLGIALLTVNKPDSIHTSRALLAIPQIVGLDAACITIRCHTRNNARAKPRRHTIWLPLPPSR